ncbi:hypothetical protein [Parasphingorhabdus sp.]|uniref:hypothetical protein n=1 Tax=Parasphingorhabdus sp. TaxID=2709688 RepID=UPI003C760308
MDHGIAEAQSIRSGVTFQWSDTQPNPASSATLAGVTVNGVVYDALTLPSSYQMLQVGPGGHTTNRIRRNGVQIESSSASASWNSNATAAFASRNLNFKFEADASNNNANICNNPGAIATTSNQIQRLSYGFGLPATTGSILAVTERNANNCYYIRIRGIPVGGDSEQILGGTFVRGGATLWGPTFGAPPNGVDYWSSGRVNSNDGTIGIALFVLDPLVPAGSIITKVDFIAADNDHGDGKVFIMQSSAPIIANDDNVSAVDGGVASANVLNVLNNDSLRGSPPTASSATISIVTPASHPGVTLNTANGFVSVSAAVPRGTYQITYRVCETSVPRNCDTAIVTVPVLGLEVLKNSKVISDPISGTSNPKAVPGAIVRYCIQIENEANSTAAESIAVVDDLSPFPVTFVPGSIRVRASVIADDCDYTTGVNGGSYDGTSVSWEFAGLRGRTSTALYFDVTVD